jgi:sterol desaturase/sphingolipid hydroxylase (fatty acid hydroxylase superfamily)
MVWQLVVFMLCEDTVFYWMHRAMHHPILYKYIHKRHHEFPNSISYAALYANPIEHVFANIIPAVAGVVLLGNRVHMVTVSIWIVWRTLENVDGHCGYEFSWSPYRLMPFSASSEFHNFHHFTNSGSFGSFFSHWDSLFGTNNEFIRFKRDSEREAKLKEI